MAWGTPSRERRVLKAGHSSIAVTLPKPWAEAMNLRPGDLVVFDQNDDGTLFLKPAPTPGNGQVGAPYLLQARSFDTPGVLERLVVGAYRVGHDAIEIRTEQPLAPERVEELLDAARRLLGVSVVAQEPTRVVLQNFIDPSKYGLPQLVQRMKMILVAYMEEAEELLQRRPRSRRLPSLAEETHRVLALLVRQLFLASRDWSLARRIGSPDPRQLLEWRVVVHALEELGEILRRMVDELNREPVRYRQQLPELAGLVGELRLGLKAVFDSLMHPTLSNACEAHAEARRLTETAHEFLLALKSPARRGGLYHVPAALERGAGRLTVLAQVAVDRAVSAGSETILLDAP
ncbi:MAG TPA: AbrB/MazE/SpoVT family DNA-binding domain-containing protein [Thermoplasmata archaeon]|nr:AbrB/MazE/SpoVT family DNA-binding domain-containing protein [Thermoplasmata archaeon]